MSPKVADRLAFGRPWLLQCDIAQAGCAIRVFFRHMSRGVVIPCRWLVKMCTSSLNIGGDGRDPEAIAEGRLTEPPIGSNLCHCGWIWGCVAGKPTKSHDLKMLTTCARGALRASRNTHGKSGTHARARPADGRRPAQCRATSWRGREPEVAERSVTQGWAGRRSALGRGPTAQGPREARRAKCPAPRGTSGRIGYTAACAQGRIAEHQAIRNPGGGGSAAPAPSGGARRAARHQRQACSRRQTSARAADTAGSSRTTMRPGLRAWRADCARSRIVALHLRQASAGGSASWGLRPKTATARQGERRSPAHPAMRAGSTIARQMTVHRAARRKEGGNIIEEGLS